MKTVRETILDKLQGTKTLAAFEKGGKKEFDYYFAYIQYGSDVMKEAHFNRLGVLAGQSVHDTHNAYCAWGTKQVIGKRKRK